MNSDPSKFGNKRVKKLKKSAKTPRSNRVIRKKKTNDRRKCDRERVDNDYLQDGDGD